MRFKNKFPAIVAFLGIFVGIATAQSVVIPITAPASATYVQVIENSGLDGRGACFVYYNVTQKSLALWSDTLNDWVGWSNLGSTGSGGLLYGDRCILEVSKTTVTKVAANTISLNLSIVFKSNFVGVSYIWAMNSTDSWWNYVGPLAPLPFPATGHNATAVSVTPSATMGTGANLTFDASSDNGFEYISQVMLQVGSTSVNGCMFMYYPPENVIQIFNDFGSNWVQTSFIGTATPPLSNSQCTLDAANATKAASSGNHLRLTLPISLSPGFSGPQALRILSIWDRSGSSSRVDNFSTSFGTLTNSTISTLSPASVSIPSMGTSDTFLVTSSPSNSSWIPIVQANASGVYPSWLHVLSYSAGFVRYSVDANPGAARSGLITVGNASFAVNQSASSSPAVNTMSPPVWTFASPSGNREAKLAITVTNATAPVSSMQVIINSGAGIQEGCYLMYFQTYQAFMVWSDSHNAWVGWSAPGGADITSDRCTVEASKSTVTPNGNSLTLNVSIAFSPAFIGPNIVFAVDTSALGHPLEPVGTFTAYPSTGHLPAPGDVSPASGTGPFVPFTFHATDDNGYGYITQMMLQVGNTSVNGCMFMYYPSGKGISLFNDQGTRWIGDQGTENPIPIGVGGTLKNSQCSLDLGSTQDWSSGNDLRLLLPITFLNYTGPKALTINAFWDREGNVVSSSQSLGTWNAAAASPASFTLDAISLQNLGVGQQTSVPVNVHPSSPVSSVSFTPSTVPNGMTVSFGTPSLLSNGHWQSMMTIRAGQPTTPGNKNIGIWVTGQ